MDKKSPSLKKHNKSQDFDSEVSVSEDDKFIYVKALLPGIPAKEVEMSFNKGILFIKAEKPEKKFFYRIAIPGFFDETVLPRATCIEGILKVVFTKNINTFIKRKNAY